jgi:hypothetical protein
MDGMASPVTAPKRTTIPKRRAAVSYRPRNRVDVEARVAWRLPTTGTTETTLRARCIELEDQIRAVCLARCGSGMVELVAAKAWATLGSWLGAPPRGEELSVTRAAQTLQHALKRLAQAAQESLSRDPPQADLFDARSAAIKAEVLRRMGMARKSARVSCFAWALLRGIAAAALLFWGFDAARAAGFVPDPLAVGPGKLALAWAGLLGAGLGSWVSYAQRSMSDDFASLQALASDTVSPRVRAAFVFACTFVGLSFFEVEFVTVKIGEFNTTGVLDKVATSLLTGVFFGLAERALPEALARRAQDFIGRVSATGTGAAPATRP